MGTRDEFRRLGGYGEIHERGLIAGGEWTVLSRALKFFEAWSFVEDKSSKNFTERARPLEAGERPCEDSPQATC